MSNQAGTVLEDYAKAIVGLPRDRVAALLHAAPPRPVTPEAVPGWRRADPDKEARLRRGIELVKEGRTYVEAAREVGLERTTLYRKAVGEVGRRYA